MIETCVSFIVTDEVVDEEEEEEEEEEVDSCMYSSCDPGECIKIPDGSYYCNCTGTDTVQSFSGRSCGK